MYRSTNKNQVIQRGHILQDLGGCNVISDKVFYKKHEKNHIFENTVFRIQNNWDETCMTHKTVGKYIVDKEKSTIMQYFSYYFIKRAFISVVIACFSGFIGVFNKTTTCIFCFSKKSRFFAIIS